VKEDEERDPFEMREKKTRGNITTLPKRKNKGEKWTNKKVGGGQVNTPIPREEKKTGFKRKKRGRERKEKEHAQPTKTAIIKRHGKK